MKKSEIIVIINKKPYTLSVSNLEAIRSIPSADRQQLIALLEVIKHEQSPAPSTVQQVAVKSNTSLRSATTANAPSHQEMLPERLRSGDADAVMAQLIMEENLKKKPGLTKRTIHKWMAAVAVVIILLILILGT